MTDTFYEIKTFIDEVSYGYAKPVAVGGFGLLSQLEDFLGFNPLPLPSYSPPAGSTVAE